MAGISLLSFLCDQPDQSPSLFMFMDEMVLNHAVNVSVDMLKACHCCRRPKGISNTAVSPNELFLTSLARVQSVSFFFRFGSVD